MSARIDEVVSKVGQPARDAQAAVIQGAAGGTPIPVSVSGGTPNAADFYTKSVVVPTPGTAVNAPAQAVASGYTITVKAKNTNTGRIKIGHSAAGAQGADAFTLGANEAVSIGNDNTNDIWIDATVAGEGVEIIVEI